MGKSITQQTSFSGGELAPALLGRPDLRAYANGAQRLRNLLIEPTGAVSRRPGLRHLGLLPGNTRLLAFEFNTEQTYLLVLSAGRLGVWMNDSEIAAFDAPWTEAMLPQLASTQSADTLLLVHPDMPPQRITRQSHTAWHISTWDFTRVPVHRFADSSITLAADALSGVASLNASADIFNAEHTGVEFLLYGKRLRITSVNSATTAVAELLEDLPSTEPTEDWQEAAFSTARGWPVCLCFHQNRLVIGGSRDLPDRLWLSQSGDLLNFDLGTGLDSEAIAFAVMADQVNAIRAVFSGRTLQVFTSGAEWMVSGAPLTPSSIQLNLQTRVGSPVDRHIAPVDVDGSTIFAARNNTALHEFAYSDVTLIYQSNDLALVAHHLINQPQALCYDQRRRLLYCSMVDGSLATLTLHRSEQITAWSVQETDGTVHSLAEIDGVVYATVLRAGTWRLERFDSALGLDAALTGSVSTPQNRWLGLEHLEGMRVGVLADGAPTADATVTAGSITLEESANTLQAGLPYTHQLVPLPPVAASGASTGAGPTRLLRVTFRLEESQSLAVDLGRGSKPVPLRRFDTVVLDNAPPVFSGDLRLRGLGWQPANAPLWQIKDATPLPMTLLSVITETRMPD